MSKKSVEERFWSKVTIKSIDKCWEWQRSTRLGYGSFWDGFNVVKSHRFSWIITYGEIPEGIKVCHKCDNPACVNPNHLFLGTQFDNMQDMIEKGRHRYVSGAMSHLSKLDVNTVIEIKHLLHKGFTPQEIADKFGVHKSTIKHINKGRSWKQVTI